MVRTKIFAAYLPQYHETDDNNKFWGHGYTDWIATKNAKNLIEGQTFPRVPLNNNYYDLSKEDGKTIKWQSELAKKYGIDGFCIYHYWFKNGKQQLEKPSEVLLKHKEIHIQYYFSWDNVSWVKSWSNITGNSWAPVFDKDENGRTILCEFSYGDKKDWKNHIDYLMIFFKDERYYKIDNKPVFAFMEITSNPDSLNIRNSMIDYWNDVLIKNGFGGIYCITQDKVNKTNNICHHFTYEPVNVFNLKTKWLRRLKYYLNIDIKMHPNARVYINYDKVWKTIINNAKRNILDTIPSAIVYYDDTPRRGSNANVVFGESCEKFYFYFKKLYEICCLNDKEFLLITAWNEWGESAYLEPDTINNYNYLESLFKAKFEVIGQSK